MIFQASIDLEIINKNVSAIVDFDTGLIGFTEIRGSESLEYNFFNCPLSFKEALFQKMEGIFGPIHRANMQICRKGESLRNIFTSAT